MSIKVIVAGFKRKNGFDCGLKWSREMTGIDFGCLTHLRQKKEVDGVPVFTDKADLVGFDADVWVDSLCLLLPMEILVCFGEWFRTSCGYNRLY